MAQSGLPYQSAAQAFSLLRTTTPDVLPWPRLPQRSLREHSLIQSISGFPGLILDNATRRAYIDLDLAEQQLDQLGLAYLTMDTSFGALALEDAAGVIELLRTTEPLGRSSALVSQLLGPISLGLQLTDKQHRPLIYNPMLLEALAHYLALRVHWLTKRLADLNLATDHIVCLDEPLLDALNSPFCPIDWEYGIELLGQVFGATRACRGMVLGNFASRQRDDHGSSGWIPLMEIAVEFLLINIVQSFPVLPTNSELLRTFFNRSGVIAWGLVPADEEMLSQETLDTLLDRFEALLDYLDAAGFSREQVLRASFISTGGSLEHLSPAAAEIALQRCAEVSTQLRALYGLDKLTD